MMVGLLKLYVVLLIGLLYSIYKGWHFIGLILKTCLGICFVSLALSSMSFNASGRFGLLVTLALLLSSIGDIYLGVNKVEEGSKDYYFYVGSIIFFGAQICYLLASLTIMDFNNISFYIPFLIFLIFNVLYKDIFKKNRNFQYLLIYGLLLTLTTMNSIINCLQIQHTVIRLFTFGISLYWFSDLLLFVNKIIGYTKQLDMSNKILYYSAQILFVFCLI